MKDHTRGFANYIIFILYFLLPTPPTLFSGPLEMEKIRKKIWSPIKLNIITKTIFHVVHIILGVMGESMGIAGSIRNNLVGRTQWPELKEYILCTHPNPLM